MCAGVETVRWYTYLSDVVSKGDGCDVARIRFGRVNVIVYGKMLC